MEILIGLLIIAVGSFGQSSSYVPIRKVRDWSWESFWLVQGIFAWIVFPWLGASLALPEGVTLGALWAAGGAWQSVFYGVLWGVGGLTFGLSMRYLGVALGQSIALGTCAAFGTLFPALLAGQNLFRGEGLALLLGVCITLAGIAVIGYAGSLRSRLLSDEERRAAVKDFALTKGLLVALLAGAMSACFSLGLESGAAIQAAAVAAGYCPGGLGTDTGGSIRLPAGWCGLYGIRSTQGQSDISGIYPRAASLDTVGAMARSARDIDLLLQILADPPLRDTLRASAPIRYLRIGVFPDLVRAKGSPEVIEAYTEAVGRWEEFGECIPVGLPLLDDPAVVDSVGTIRSYEFARDIRKDIEGNPFAGKMHPVPLADYKNGQQATPEAYHAALLHKQALSRQVDAFFASLQVDFLLLPVAFSTAPSIDAPQEAFTAGRALVNLFSVAGVPTLVVPGELTAGGMPLGIQLVGPALSERLLLDAGTAYETTYGPFPTPPLVSA